MGPGPPAEDGELPTKPGRELEIVPNPEPGREYVVRMVCPEFTCLCPRTGQPDFATIVVEYVPGAGLVELKSLKLYLWSWRDEGVFHEAVVNRLLDDLREAAAPRWMRVAGFFRVRGGIITTVVASTGSVPEGVSEWPAPPGAHEA